MSQAFNTRYTFQFLESAKHRNDSPQLMYKPMPNPKKEASQYFPLLAGSMTVEAALVLPLIVGLFLFFLVIFRMLQIETGVRESLTYATRRTAVSVTSSEATDTVGLLGQGQLIFRKTFHSKKKEHSEWGKLMSDVSLYKSKIEDQYISLCASYKITIPGLGIKKMEIPVCITSSSRFWSGESLKDTEYVYITKTGSVYHKTNTCSSIKINIESVPKEEISSKRNRSGQKYSPCQHCADKNTDDWLYITPHGEAYHSSLDCKDLRRSLKRVPIDEVEGRRPCSVCW